MADVNIKYKGTSIATIDASGSKTLQTSGKYCEGDITVEYTDPEKPTQAKSATPTETAQDITPDSGKVLSKVSVGAIPKTYVGSGVTRKAAATVAPSTSEQTVCASGVYTTGEQKVSAITPSIVGNLDASSFAAPIVAAIEGKGVTVPDGTLLDGMAALIESIEAGGSAKIYKEKVTFNQSTSNYTIEHNLGVIPNFCILYTLDNFEYLGMQETASIFCGILDGSMIYTAVGTSNSGTSTKANANVTSLSYTNKIYEHLEAIRGKSIVVPYTISESSILMRGTTYRMPAGTYFIMCGII